ncbi:SLATT domain-containing protein [Leyella stercorea]|uniref:SLATT domain-containing protein n=1 Tax=Leyella stercorea TaxID=363265 RepID=UPI003F816BD2
MYLEEFSNTVYKTMCARFTAFRRVKRNRDASKVAETLFSASIIGISLIALMSNNLEVSKNISVFTIILSTFLLSLSLLLSGLSYDKRMDNYHACGNELSRLYRNMHHDVKTLTEEEQKRKESDYIDQYFNILNKYNQNHTSFDYEYAMSLFSDSTMGIVSRLWLKIRYYILDMYLVYWSIAIVPVVWIAWYCLYKGV